MELRRGGIKNDERIDDEAAAVSRETVCREQLPGRNVFAGVRDATTRNTHTRKHYSRSVCSRVRTCGPLPVVCASGFEADEERGAWDPGSIRALVAPPHHA